LRSKGKRSSQGHWERKCKNRFSAHIFVKSGPIYVKPRLKQESLANAKIAARQLCVVRV